ncbi:response regulator receiver protein [Crinalium epipsammum PCC 9333]|uniref:Response regulator receiver protein n=1 Tax=Crinalium epipsammum PCC 9333 TaxID=1173022 RepID=K9VWP2_9CYAN|nr:response regulator [Crinalium epipsammum]AFZ11917.1 response regulator receiver protein [Crinalium epipsammum PCC 9333]
MVNQLLIHQFQKIIKEKFSGRLNIKSDSGVCWSIFFGKGQLIWATGGFHPARRWQRTVMQHCPKVNPKALTIRETEDFASDKSLGEHKGQYYALRILVKQQQMTQQQATAVITGMISEVLFDIVQQSALQPLNYTDYQQQILEPPLTLLSTEATLKQTLQVWKAWREAGLTKQSPNLAPVVRNQSKLQEQTSAAAYKNFITRINGKSTLRDLAVQMKQNFVALSRSLLPYMGQGIIGLVEVPDMVTQANAKAGSQTTKEQVADNSGLKVAQTQSLSPLVACIDDSPQTCQMMEGIFTQEGFRFLGIEDSMQALPKLIEQKPDLIFLDLMMPVVNGYEICAQLRKISAFANTPIIILTGSDGLIDRVRAKKVGATDFLTKPVDAQKLLGIPHQYLGFSLLSKIGKPAKSDAVQKKLGNVS